MVGEAANPVPGIGQTAEGGHAPNPAYNIRHVKDVIDVTAPEENALSEVHFCNRGFESLPLRQLAFTYEKSENASLQ